MDVSTLYSKGTRVWLVDSDEVWVPGVVVSLLTDGKMSVMREDSSSMVDDDQKSSVMDTSVNIPPLRNPELLLGANDLTTLSYLHEPAVLHNLRIRYQGYRSIYTYCGIVLVAINPYTPIPIYGNEIAVAYSNYQLGELEPHIFAVAEDAYRTMTRDGCDQSIVVSGESGAGKTVTAKYAMRYFAMIGSGASRTMETEETQVEMRVLASNPIMEAIGNAKTVRNDNSSRFGKYLNIGFNSEHVITGAHMRTYLLELTRCVRQAEGERNYHVFYQLCAAASENELKDIQLCSASEYFYTNQGRDIFIDDVDDLLEFRNTRDSLGLLGFRDDQQQQLFRVLAAILNLGNVEVGVAHSRDDEMGSVSSRDIWLERAARLLDVDKTSLHKWLTHRKISTVRETFTKPLTFNQIVAARDSLSKHLYGHLFQWVVSQLNHTLSSDEKSHAYIGILDIYGFEVFEVNSFEQFCINYANEKLQQQFNLHVFKLEQQEYVKEAIEWSFIDFYDNQPCIDLIEGRLGMYSLLDETCKFPGGDDYLLVQKLCDVHNGKSRHFSKPLTSPSVFSIQHYAGAVLYESTGFVEKNRDNILPEHIALLRTSQLQLISLLFPSNKVSAQTTTGKKRSPAISSVGSQFQGSLSDLMRTLNSTVPHYIRCIKPNDQRIPFLYSPHRVVQQLRACGVLETIRISAAGYPSRWTYKDFYQRYRPLLPRGYFRKGEESAMVVAILKHTIQSDDLYRLGRTKVFFRAGQVAYLEKLRQSKLYACGVLIQKNVRAWLTRAHFLRLKGAVLWLQSRARGYLARRMAEHMKQTRAAIEVQKTVRVFLQRRRYSRLRQATIAMQAYVRGRAARKEYKELLYNSKAVVIQRHIRGWLTRHAYFRMHRHVIIVQSTVRRWLARRELKRLKVEARSVDNLKKLNRGMENKIIELQQKLTKQITWTQSLQSRCQKWEEEQAQDHASLAECHKTIERLEFAMRKERSTMEERINSALAEKVELQNKLTKLESDNKELESNVRELESKIEELESNIRELESECDKEKEEFEDPVADFPITSCFSPVKKSLSISEQTGSPRFQTSVPEPDQDKDINSILMELKSYQISTPHGNNLYSKHFETDSLERVGEIAPGTRPPLTSQTKSLTNEENGDRVSPQRSRITDSLERSKVLSRSISRRSIGRMQGPASSSPLLDQSMAGLRHAYNLINSLASMNVSLQDQVTRLTHDIMMITEQSVVKQKPHPLNDVHRHGGVALTPLSPSRQDSQLLSDATNRTTPSLSKSLSQHGIEPYLGMLSWQPADLSRLLKTLISDLKPEDMAGGIPCLPAHLLFMCLRYVDYSRNGPLTSGLLQGIISALQKVCHNYKDINLLAFWLANTTRLRNHLHQYSGQQNEEASLVNFDLSEYKQLLRHQSTVFYHQIIDLVHSELKPLIVPGLMEHDSIPGISSSRPIGSRSFGHTHPVVTVETILSKLTDVVDCLTRNYLDPSLTQQILRQLFYLINTYMLNILLLRREFCHWSKGVQIRYNVSQLEDWCRLQGPAGEGVAMELAPIVQASKLLQMKKNSTADVSSICDLCTQLNALQVQKILTMYTPLDGFEERVPEEVIQLVAEMGGADGVDPTHIMIDVTRFYPVELSYLPADVCFAAITLPKTLNLSFLQIM